MIRIPDSEYQNLQQFAGLEDLVASVSGGVLGPIHEPTENQMWSCFVDNTLQSDCPAFEVQRQFEHAFTRFEAGQEDVERFRKTHQAALTYLKHAAPAYAHVDPHRFWQERYDQLADDRLPILRLVETHLARIIQVRNQAEHFGFCDGESPSPFTNRCFRCTAPATQVCGRCGLVRYSCRACQVEDWPFHKLFCKKPVTSA